MEHTYGITFNTSFKYREKIENIGDMIRSKFAIRNYFGGNPFLTPNKDILVFKKDENQFILGISENPVNSNINLTVKYKMAEKSFEEVSKVTKECCDIIVDELRVSILRIGSMFNFSSSVDDGYEFLQKNFVTNFINDKYSFCGGEYKFLYRITPECVGKALNINIKMDCEEVRDKLNFFIDINNKEINESLLESGDIIKIGQYSFDFVNGEFISLIRKKGLKVDG